MSAFDKRGRERKGSTLLTYLLALGALTSLLGACLWLALRERFSQILIVGFAVMFLLAFAVFLLFILTISGHQDEHDHR